MKTAHQIDVGEHILQLGDYKFKCENIVEGVAINPKLPTAFSYTDNDVRPHKHLAWWGIAYVEFQTGERYDVRCLDGGAWDRPTWMGSHTTLEQAVQSAKAITTKNCANRINMNQNTVLPTTVCLVRRLNGERCIFFYGELQPEKFKDHETMVEHACTMAEEKKVDLRFRTIEEIKPGEWQLKAQGRQPESMFQNIRDAVTSAYNE